MCFAIIWLWIQTEIKVLNIHGKTLLHKCTTYSWTSTLQGTTFLCFTINSSQLGKQKERIFGQWTHWMPPTLDLQYLQSLSSMQKPSAVIRGSIRIYNKKWYRTFHLHSENLSALFDVLRCVAKCCLPISLHTIVKQAFLIHYLSSF